MAKLIGLIFAIWASMSGAETVRLAVTTSFQNSGLSDVLLPKIKSDTGIELQVLVVGTGPVSYTHLTLPTNREV